MTYHHMHVSLLNVLIIRLTSSYAAELREQGVYPTVKQ